MAKPKKSVDDEKPYLKLDANDSVDPSYTNLTLPYRVICRQRYHRAGVEQREQFCKEITEHELLQMKAFDGVRIHRLFCQHIFTPFKKENIIKLSYKQRMKLEEIMSRNY